MVAVLSKCYRAGDGYYRVQIVPDPECESPRDVENTALLLTWESSYASPDSRAEIPGYLTPAIARWCGGGRDFSRPVKAAAVVRYCRAYLADRIYAVAGLQRGPGGQLLLDLNPDPDPGGWYDGLALVTSASWVATMGPDIPHAELAEEVLRQELGVYRDWMSGNIYGYEVERFDGDSWVHQEACYGFIGDPDGYVLQAALDTLPDDRTEVSEDDVRSAVVADPYLADLAGLIEAFRFTSCEECGNDLDQHLIGPDPLGKPHLWCITAGEGPTCPKDGQSFEQHYASGIRYGHDEATQAIRTAAKGWLSQASIDDLVSSVTRLLTEQPPEEHS